MQRPPRPFPRIVTVVSPPEISATGGFRGCECRRDWRASSVLSGSFAASSGRVFEDCRYVALETISFCIAFTSQPERMNSVASQSSSSGFDGSVPILPKLPGVLTMPVVSAGATWVIGKVFIQHFASGGTLLDFNPPDYREFIKTQREKLGTRSGAVRPAAPSAAPATRSA